VERSPEDPSQLLARSLARIRPELDLYLMTEIAVEDMAGPLDDPELGQVGAHPAVCGCGFNGISGEELLTPLVTRYLMCEASTDMISPLRSWPISCPEESPMCRVASGSSRARPRA
jgi:hypothetical protein